MPADIERASPSSGHALGAGGRAQVAGLQTARATTAGAGTIGSTDVVAIKSGGHGAGEEGDHAS
jgi:hypothetical protein